MVCKVEGDAGSKEVASPAAWSLFLMSSAIGCKVMVALSNLICAVEHTVEVLECHSKIAHCATNGRPCVIANIVLGGVKQMLGVPTYKVVHFRPLSHPAINWCQKDPDLLGKKILCHLCSSFWWRNLGQMDGLHMKRDAKMAANVHQEVCVVHAEFEIVPRRGKECSSCNQREDGWQHLAKWRGYGGGNEVRAFAWDCIVQ
eukprot:6860824-Ditylum_brightwellii.AAC.1